MATKHAVPKVPAVDFVAGFFTVMEEAPKNGDTALMVKLRSRELFPSDRALAEAFEVRFRALLEVLDREEFRAWVRTGQDDAMHFHPALLDAASQVKVNKNGRYPVKRLLALVTDNEREIYGDWEWP